MAFPLERFSPLTKEWFEGAFADATPAQVGAWDAIASGRDALVVAPTGSGKTLAAFLWALDRLAAAASLADPKRLLEANRTTGSQVTTGDRRPGFERWVYGRAGRPCRRCGTPIVSEQDGTGPVLYRCPSCQPPL